MGSKSLNFHYFNRNSFINYKLKDHKLENVSCSALRLLTYRNYIKRKRIGKLSLEFANMTNTYHNHKAKMIILLYKKGTVAKKKMKIYPAAAFTQ